MSIRSKKQKKDFRFNLDELELINLKDLVGTEVTINDCDWINCKDGSKRLAVVTSDNKFFFGSTVFEKALADAAADTAGEDYLELRAGLKIKIVTKTSQRGQDYYDFDILN